MSETSNKLDTIADIEYPLPPMDPGWDPLWLSIIVIISLCMAAWMFNYWRHQPRQTCLQRLSRLQQQHRRAHIDCHTVIFRLSDILRTRFNCTYVSAGLTLSPQIQQYQHRWLSFSRNMNTLRYSGESLNAAKVSAVLDESRFWLKAWPR